MMDIEKVKNIKELLRCMNGEKACWDCGLNEIAENQETCCVNIIADMTLELINDLESKVEDLKCELQETRQETARDVLQTIKNHRNGIEARLKDSVWEVSGTDLYEEHLCRVVDEYGFFDILDDIAKQYNVEEEKNEKQID